MIKRIWHGWAVAENADDYERLLLGEMAEQTLLSDIDARPEKLLASGYVFRHPELEVALRHELGLPPDD